MRKLLKSEAKIVEEIRRSNDKGLLRWLSTSPQDPNFGSRKHRFIKRLWDNGKVIWVPWTGKFGAGWALPETVEYFVKNS